MKEDDFSAGHRWPWWYIGKQFYLVWHLQWMNYHKFWDAYDFLTMSSWEIDSSRILNLVPINRRAQTSIHWLMDLGSMIPVLFHYLRSVDTFHRFFILSALLEKISWFLNLDENWLGIFLGSLSFQEAASLGVIPLVSFKDSPIVVDVRNFQIHTAEVS